jgi:transcriptional regulator with XRE-family HTH domain
MTSEVMDLSRVDPYSSCMSRPSVGELVRDWRTRRRRSQLDLALDVGVSTRHLSFVETGRSRPSPELILALAHHLDVPLRERNTLLLAGGYAPRFSQRPLDDPAMASVRSSIQRMLDAHDPYPGVVIDRAWNVVQANRTGLGLVTGLPDHVIGPPLNIYRTCLHPDGLARRTTNFTDWATYLLGQLRRSVALTGDPLLEALEAEVLAYPNVAQITPMVAGTGWDDPPILVPFDLATPLGEVSMFTTITVFGTPLDVTIDDLALELFYPADDESAHKLRDLAVAAV